MEETYKLQIIMTPERQKLLNKCRQVFSENTASRTVTKAMKLSINWFENKDDFHLNQREKRKINPNKKVVKGIGMDRKKQGD